MPDLPTNNSQDLTLAGLVHDLKNVFETLGEAADLLSTDPGWTGLAGAIERAVEQGRRITASFQESVETFDLELILENATQCTRDFLMSTHRPELQFRRQLGPGLRLAGRPGAWERVFVNLFLNSAQAMRDGGELEITAQRKDSRIQITVSDSGPGIPQDILGRVFLPGFSTSRAHSGLGLSIVESIVCEHGGTITAGNRTPRGATFTISLPDSQISVTSQAYTASSESVPQAGVNERA